MTTAKGKEMKTLAGPCGDAGFCLDTDETVVEFRRPAGGLAFSHFAIFDIGVETKLDESGARAMLVVFDEEGEHLRVALHQVKHRRRWPTQIFSGTKSPLCLKAVGLECPIDVRIYWEAIGT